MSEKINETEVEKVSPELDCIFAFDDMKIVNHINENS